MALIYVRKDNMAKQEAGPELPAKVADDLLENLKSCRTKPQRMQSIIIDFLSNDDAWGAYDLPMLVKINPPLSRVKVEAIGSSSEGLSLTEVSDLGPNEEFDFTVVSQSLKASEKRENCNRKSMAHMLYCDQYPGYVYIKLIDPETASEWNGLCNIVANETGEVNEFYLSPVAVTDEYYLLMSYRSAVENLCDIQAVNVAYNPEHEHRSNSESDFAPASDDSVNTYGAVCSNEDSNTESSDKIKTYTWIIQEGPAIKTTLIRKYDSSFVSAQYDCAFAVECTEWPHVALEWTERERPSGWPSQDIVQSVIADGCLIVPKSPTDSVTNLEWRLSFCLAERKLMQSLSEEQKICYLLMKAIWRKFLKPPAGKALQSYHLKNVLLHECESVSPDAWTPETTVERVLALLARLKSYLSDGYCPHYILPANNLFQEIDKSVLARAAERVQTCIIDARIVWVENTDLISLPPVQTRLGMSKCMVDKFLQTVEKIYECITREDAELKLEESLLSEKDCEELRSCLNEVVDENITEFVTEYLLLQSRAREDNDMRRYICSRAAPKELVQAAKHGGLDALVLMINVMTGFGEMIDLITHLDILTQGDFKEHGFPEHFPIVEKLRLVFEYTNMSSQSQNLSSLLSGNMGDLDFENDDLLAEKSEEVEYFVCDACNKDIEGLRFHCLTCEDYDLCPTCFESKKGHCDKHDFIEREFQ